MPPKVKTKAKKEKAVKSRAVANSNTKKTSKQSDEDEPVPNKKQKKEEQEEEEAVSPVKKTAAPKSTAMFNTLMYNMTMGGETVDTKNDFLTDAAKKYDLSLMMIQESQNPKEMEKLRAELRKQHSDSWKQETEKETRFEGEQITGLNRHGTIFYRSSQFPGVKKEEDLVNEINERKKNEEELTPEKEEEEEEKEDTSKKRRSTRQVVQKKPTSYATRRPQVLSLTHKSGVPVVLSNFHNEPPGHFSGVGYNNAHSYLQKFNGMPMMQANDSNLTKDERSGFKKAAYPNSVSWGNYDEAVGNKHVKFKPVKGVKEHLSSYDANINTSKHAFGDHLPNVVQTEITYPVENPADASSNEGKKSADDEELVIPNKKKAAKKRKKE